MEKEIIAQNILDFLSRATEGMNDEQAVLFVSGYCFGLAVGDPELFEIVNTLAKWENMMGGLKNPLTPPKKYDIIKIQ